MKKWFTPTIDVMSISSTEWITETGHTPDSFFVDNIAQTEEPYKYKYGESGSLAND